jgi:hypothetical protein
MRDNVLRPARGAAPAAARTLVGDDDGAVHIGIARSTTQ